MKKIFDKKIILSFIALAVMFMAFSVNADITYNAEGVLYKKGNSNVSLKDELDSLNEYVSYGNATAGDIVSGKTALVNGKKITGTYMNTGTYTFEEGSTGSKVDLGSNNTYRYVDATNVYNKGKEDGAADFKSSGEINNVVLSVTAKTQDAKSSGSFALSTALIDTIYCKWSQPGSHYGGSTYKCANNTTGKLSNLTCSESGADVSACDAVTVTVTCNGRNNSGFTQSGTCKATVSSNPF